MAQFIAQIRGQRGEASRLGSKVSGIDAKVSGWSIGARVTIEHEDGRDVVAVLLAKFSTFEEMIHHTDTVPA